MFGGVVVSNITIQNRVQYILRWEKEEGRGKEVGIGFDRLCGGGALYTYCTQKLKKSEGSSNFLQNSSCTFIHISDYGTTKIGKAGAKD